MLPHASLLRRALLAPLVGFLALAPAAHAQFGGLVKKAIGNEAAKRAGVAPAAPGRGGRDAEEPEIALTSEALDRYIAGKKAEQAEIAKAKAEPGPYGAFLKKKEAAEACEAQRESVIAKASTGQVSSEEYQRVIKQECVDPEAPDEYYEAARRVEERAKREFIRASGLTQNQLFGAEGLDEKIQRYMANGRPRAGRQLSGEAGVVGARYDELLAVFPELARAERRRAESQRAAAEMKRRQDSIEAESRAMQAKAKADQEKFARENPQAAAQQQCMMAQMNDPERMKKLQKEIEDAQKKGDMDKAMALSMGMMADCMPGAQGSKVPAAPKKR